MDIFFFKNLFEKKKILSVWADEALICKNKIFAFKIIYYDEDFKIKAFNGLLRCEYSKLSIGYQIRTKVGDHLKTSIPKQLFFEPIIALQSVPCPFCLSSNHTLTENQNTRTAYIVADPLHFKKKYSYKVFKTAHAEFSLMFNN